MQVRALAQKFKEGKATGLVAEVQIDLEKTFDAVTRSILLDRAKHENYPIANLGLALQSYTWPRMLAIGTAVSRKVWPTCGIAVGSATAVAELAMMLNQAINRLNAALPSSITYVHVDDISTTLQADTMEEMADQAHILAEFTSTNLSTKESFAWRRTKPSSSLLTPKRRRLLPWKPRPFGLQLPPMSNKSGKITALGGAARETMLPIKKGECSRAGAQNQGQVHFL
jgi:hypothetical protein